ncbi:MAG TPA: MerR family transcriptional regulator [Myxococcota bacterium]|nr:MerR family transcriptional regulator [Myxococcota bacterium]
MNSQDVHSPAPAPGRGPRAQRRPRGQWCGRSAARPSCHVPNSAPHDVRASRLELSPELLRAWERRYGVFQPHRTPGGSRRYSAADLEQLRLVKAAVDATRQPKHGLGGHLRNVGSVVQTTSQNAQKFSKKPWGCPRRRFFRKVGLQIDTMRE